LQQERVGQDAAHDFALSPRVFRQLHYCPPCAHEGRVLALVRRAIDKEVERLAPISGKNALRAGANPLHSVLDRGRLDVSAAVAK